MKAHISSRDLKLLSLYLDEQLNPAQRRRLEKRLIENPLLHQTLEELRLTRVLLRKLPRVHPPRNFTLSPQMVGSRSTARVYPVWGFVSALAGFLFVLVLAGDLLGAFAHSQSSVAMKQTSVIEAAAPVAEIAQDENARIAPTGTVFPPETRVVEAQEALKAVVPAAQEDSGEETPTHLLTLTPAGTPSETLQDTGEAVNPMLEGMNAKEAPLSEPEGAVGIAAAGVVTTTEVLEKELPPEVALTEEGSMEEIVSSPTLVGRDASPFQTATPPASSIALMPVEGEDFTQTGETAASQLDEAEPLTEFGAGNQAPTTRSNLLPGWVLEVILAVTALVAGGLFFVQRYRARQ